MPKSDIHPTWSKDTPVLWDGKPLCFVGSTKKELQVDIWLATPSILYKITSCG